MKEKASALASSGLKKDSKIKQLEISVQKKAEEAANLDAQLKKVNLCLVLVARTSSF